MSLVWPTRLGCRPGCRKDGSTVATRIIVALAMSIACAPVSAFAQDTTSAQTRATSPLTIHLGDADFLIGGFIDAGAVVRSTNVGSGMATTFSTIPFENTPQGHLHETRLSSQSTRLNLLITTRAGGGAVRSFLEIDFLGAGPSNAFVTTNAHTPRMRHAWVQYSRGTFEFTGGQAWSLLTPNRNGISPVSGDVVFSQNFDPNLQLGLVWARQTQFRIVAHPSKTIAAGISVENGQPFIGAVDLPASFPAAEVDSGNTPGAPSPYPDIIGKIAFDPQTGTTHQHVEAAVLVRGYRTYSPTADRTFSATGSGFSVTGVFEPVKGVHVIGTTLVSDGGGRYMIGQAPDFMVNADGSITTIGSTSGMVGVEAQIRPPTMVFGYYGTVRIDQEVSTDGNTPIGYGVAGDTGANRSIDETTAGVNHAFFRNPNYGALHLILQYSYVARTPWSVPEGTPSSAHAHVFYVAARYVIP
jgi:hypothetical protein